MNSILKDKRLLVLGSSANEVNLVKRAKELGVYVIVTDYFDDNRLTPARNYADEVWFDDWSNVDHIVRKCKELNVDGVTAGYSEIKIDYLIKICEKLSFPCYSTADQLEITRDKIKFKNMCRKCGVPTVKEYSNIEDVNEYPVIVKPTDRGGSIGISIANNKDELINAYNYALSMSLEKNVIIEKYMSDRKIDVYYSIIDGKIEQLTTNDTIMSVNNGLDKVVQAAWYYPHNQSDTYFLNVEPNLKKMIKEMGISNGCIFFSGFYNEILHSYAFFECGFRLEGAHQYNYTEKKGPFNYLDLFIYHALTGSAKNITRPMIVDNNLKQVIVNYYAKKGTISSIEGFDKVESMENCIFSLITSYVGEVCSDDNAILNKIGMFAITNTDPFRLQEDVKKAMSYIRVLDENGKDMIYSKFDCTSISEHWKN